MGGQIITQVLMPVIFLSLTWGEETVVKYYTSIYGKMCYDACSKAGRDYYWCNTKKGWDYCSIQENTDYKGNKCEDYHPCDMHGENYYWCRLKKGGWDYCGKVKLGTEPKQYVSSTYQSECKEECSKDESESYSWCTTDKGWDYCSVTHDVTYKHNPCQPDHPCDTHGYRYLWCKTNSGWEYCGLVQSGGICSTITRRKRSEDDEMCFIDHSQKRVTKFTKEPHSYFIADGRRWEKEIRNIIARWHNGYLSNRAKSHIITTENLQLDMHWLEYRFGKPYYKIQIQISMSHQRHATLAEVAIPQNEEVPDRYIRRAFTESFCNHAKVILNVTHSNVAVKLGQNCDN